MASVDTLDYASALNYLVGRINYEQTQMPYRLRSFKLARMERLLSLVGDPQWKYPAVHLAGTKGKGSTAVMIEAMLRAAGYRTGLYTSPHLERIEERFVVEGTACDAATFVALVQRVQPAVEMCEQLGRTALDEDCAPTYFEITTAMAMLLFAERGVDVAVLEVGLGGRLDSTNICRPAVSIITSISFDHTQQLGNTLAAIAREKAGIIKPEVPVVSGVKQSEPAEVIREVARENNSGLLEVDRDFGIEPTGDDETRTLRYWNQAFAVERSGIHVAMLGQHQAANAAVAMAAVDTLRAAGWKISDSAIRSGLAHAACGARIEVVSRNPTVIIDAAHNVASIAALVEVLARDFAGCAPQTLIFATSRDKDVHGMLALLVPRFDRVLLTRYDNNPRSADPQELWMIASQLAAVENNGARGKPRCEIQAFSNSRQALAAAQAASDAASLVCVAGSFFLAAELRPHFAGSTPDSSG
jgi:dihydrofolate synthase/folylpolyglutamate synthase